MINDPLSDPIGDLVAYQFKLMAWSFLAGALVGIIFTALVLW